MRSPTIWPENSATSAAAQPQEPVSRQSNVFILLAQREISPQTKRSPRRFWGSRKALNTAVDSCVKKMESHDAKQDLRSWAEAESLLHLSNKYCPLLPHPRSTIAAAFSPDGMTLASTHGDHTVKIIDCPTGKCLKVLSGHRRTPWVVRFHPLYPEVVASGSLDHEVRLWDAKTGECIGSRDFYRPIASLAFDPLGEILAVASGHKLYIWRYSRRGKASSPTIILRTLRSLRAVQFHPHGAPILLTAEVNDLDFSDPSMSIAASPGYLSYPPPTIYVAARSSSENDSPITSMPFVIWPSLERGDEARQTDAEAELNANDRLDRADSSASLQLLTFSTPSGQYELVLSPIQSPAQEEEQSSGFASLPGVDATETDVPTEDQSNQLIQFGDLSYLEVPFLQGWLLGENQAGQHTMQSQNESLPRQTSMGVTSLISSRVLGRSNTTGPRSLRSRTRRSIVSVSGNNTGPPEQTNAQPIINQVQSEVATSLAAPAAAELPCTVKLRIWSHDLKNPCAPLDMEMCRLTIPHAVLCSEMGAHFSPCGRFLAVCVACVMPNNDPDSSFHAHAPHASSPTRHPISSQQVIYELRIYSLEKASFGSVLASRAIRAAHCLTSIQFSPTSEHLLLAYGRRHSSLLRSVLINGDTTVSIYTILEIYKVSDMELVRVLPSSEDEVNVACFHPSVGGGFVYGTKEGKLRSFQCNVSEGFKCAENSPTDDIMYEDVVSSKYSIRRT